MSPAQLAAKEHEIATLRIRLSELEASLNRDYGLGEANPVIGRERGVLLNRIEELLVEIAEHYFALRGRPAERPPVSGGFGPDAVTPSERLRMATDTAFRWCILWGAILGAIIVGVIVGLNLPLRW